MVINGLMKMTLLDFPGRVACTVFTAGCNMRCPFCHNAPLVTDIDPLERIGTDEIFRFLKKRVGLLDGVAITGGEPLLQLDIEDFIREIRALGFAVKLDTNGTFPDRLKALVDSHLVDYVAMDIKNDPEHYPHTVGAECFDLAPIEESKNLLLSGVVDYEFRTTVVAQFHSVGRIRAAAEWIAGAKRYFLQSFTDSGNLISEGLTAAPKDVMEEMCRAAREFVPDTELRGI